jgi:hypothetical protein
LISCSEGVPAGIRRVGDRERLEYLRGINDVRAEDSGPSGWGLAADGI